MSFKKKFNILLYENFDRLWLWYEFFKNTFIHISVLAIWKYKKSNYNYTFIIFSCTTTTGGYFAIQISSQTTKKDVSEIPLLRTIIPHKLLSFCNTITFAPVQSQVLRNSRTWYNNKTFPITTASIHCLRLTLHRKLFVANPSSQQFSEPTQKSIGFWYKI
jgi:hypothetical protein